MKSNLKERIIVFLIGITAPLWIVLVCAIVCLVGTIVGPILGIYALFTKKLCGDFNVELSPFVDDEL